MVCDRCKTVLKKELSQAGIEIISLELGELIISDKVSVSKKVIEEIAKRNGFELVEDKNQVLITEVKNQMIIALEENRLNKNLSEHLSSKLNRDYSILSKIFSANEGITIEKYFIRLKIEKVKELIQMKNKTFSEIAYELNYANSGHLAKQFKSITGMSMGEYQKVRDWNRKPFDQIV